MRYFPSFLCRYVLVPALLCFATPSFGQQPGAPAPAASAAPDPALELWLAVKKELSGPGGRDYFDLKMLDRHLPDPANGIEHFKGVVISSKPTARPSEFVLAMTDGKTPEVTLTLRDARQNLVPLTKPVPPGSGIEFAGIPYAFTQNPFMVSFEVKLIASPSSNDMVVVRNEPGKHKK
jgi:hypothetical protein